MIEEAVHQVVRRFPFPGYTDPANRAYNELAQIALEYLPPGSRILDFGCGPCDKAAILQLLGYKCSAYDDLQDHWHQLPGNRAKIVRFAEEVGIHFTLGQDTSLPYSAETFDMVMLNHVLEHLHTSPRFLLNELLGLVKPKGLLLITVPNAVNARKRLAVLLGKTNYPPFDGFYWYPGIWRGHVREYVRNDLVRLSDYLNLDGLELRGTDHMLTRLPPAFRRPYLLVTRLFPSLKDSWLFLGQKKPDWTAKKELSTEELESLLGKSTSYQY
jgi:SAM-dependent methyltransferase